jgi:hypothetical protein
VIKIEKYIYYFFAAIVFALVIILAWLSNYGLDLSDESLYLVGYHFGIEPTILASYFHRIFNLFFGVFDFSIPQIRLLRLILTLSSSILLVYSVIQFCKYKIEELSFNNKLFLTLLVLIGALLSYSFGPLSLSYNSFSIIFLMLTFSTWLTIHQSKKYYFFKNILLGILIGLSFYNKITNFILLFGLLPLASFLIKLIDKQTFWRALIKTIIQYLFVLIGAFICFYIFFNHSLSFNENIAIIIRGFSQTDESYTMIKLLNDYAIKLDALYSNTYKWILRLMVFEIVFYVVNKRYPFKVLPYFRYAFLIGLITYFLYHNTHLLGKTGLNYYYFEIHLVLYISACIYGIQQFKKEESYKYKLVLIVTSFFMLLVGSLGTNSYLTAAFLFYLAFLYLSLFFILKDVQKEIKIILLSFVLMVSCFQILNSTIIFPYRQLNLLENKSIIAKNETLKNLYLDDNQINIAYNLRFLKSSDVTTVFTYNFHLGFCLILEKEPYAFGWISDSDAIVNSKIIEESKNQDPTSIVFLIPEFAPLNEQLINALKSKKVYFKEDYRLVKTIKYYDYSEKSEQLLYVYLHKSKL